MKRLYRYLLPLCLLVTACGSHRAPEEVPQELTPWQQDSLLRIEIENADHTSLDSLLTAWMGEPAECISVLRDYVRVGDEFWYLNSSFGMALQLPGGFVPDEWTNLDFVSHGAMITSPDSPIVIHVTAWYDVLEPEDREELLKQEREEKPDDYIRQVVAQGVEYTLWVEHGKGTEKEFKAMLPYLERFPEGPHGLIAFE